MRTLRSVYQAIVKISSNLAHPRYQTPSRGRRGNFSYAISQSAGYYHLTINDEEGRAVTIHFDLGKAFVDTFINKFFDAEEAFVKDRTGERKISERKIRGKNIVIFSWGLDRGMLNRIDFFSPFGHAIGGAFIAHFPRRSQQENPSLNRRTRIVRKTFFTSAPAMV